ncbi:hypothetical protein M758_4G222000 [Ceratodon purpureus]|nr:hypothetical protein M758_4G222000 [Ceratodon purpureus]
MSTEGLSAEQNASRGYTITRVLSASRERVWDAWTKPEQFAIWFGGHQCRMEDMLMDVRPGGDWSGTMVLPDGTSTISWRGHFLELDHPSRLVLDFTDQGAEGKEFDSFTVTLTTLSPNETQMVVRQSGGHLTDEQYKEAEKGTGMFMDVLAEMIAGDV